MVGVSIPHRFNSHSLSRGTTLSCFTSFNPSQVQFTLGAVMLKFQIQSVFQSLTGSIHNQYYVLIEVGVNPFQSLTGSIHTRVKIS